ncbi:MAG: 3-dehydroquinate synthase [Alphaproteobacteria bacterium]|nr:3-dehydroquinate synthase [Alphaproteobacteria bacterium]MCB9697886.1 3-dehydroquinate synthase [Alphaproteobacteria bacterium]
MRRFATSRGVCSVAVTPTLDDLPTCLAERGVGEAVLVTDEVVDPLWGDRLRARVPVRATLRLPSGEEHKTLATWERVVDELLRVPVDRATTVVALGGGVVGDVAGFAAAVTLRGLDVVQVPTTLLAMVDASIGGKTAVDHPLGKNLVGAFHPPLHVHAALETLSTLDAVQIAAGRGEVVKTALALDAGLFARLEAEAAPGHADVVRACVDAKIAVVTEDEREQGRRVVLNAGHTVGHAIERTLGYGVLPHGLAVMIGLVLEADHAVRTGVCEDSSLPDRLRAIGRRLGLPVELPAGLDPADLVAAASLDKKGRADTIRVPLPVRVGCMVPVDLPKRDLHHLFHARPTPT